MAMCGTCYTTGRDRPDPAPGLSGRVGEYMIESAAPPARPIAAVLADVDGTLVTSAKMVTRRAIEAIETLHQRGVLFAITSGRPPRGLRMLVHPLELPSQFVHVHRHGILRSVIPSMAREIIPD